MMKPGLGLKPPFFQETIQSAINWWIDFAKAVTTKPAKMDGVCFGFRTVAGGHMQMKNKPASEDFFT